MEGLASEPVFTTDKLLLPLLLTNIEFDTFKYLTFILHIGPNTDGLYNPISDSIIFSYATLVIRTIGNNRNATLCFSH